MNSQAQRQKGRLDRLLSVFTEVHPGEGALALLMACNIFLLLTSYYLIKPVREALILVEGGAEAKSYLVGAMTILLFFLVQGYAKLVSRFERTRLITVVTLLFVVCLVTFWILSRMGLSYLGYAFFVWVGIFSVMIVAQFWSYANDVYSSESGKRLFPLVAFGGNVGAFAGAWIATRFLAFLDVFELLLVAAALLGICVAITNLVSRRVWGKAEMAERQEQLSEKRRGRKESSRRKERASLGFDMLFRHKYIGLVAALVLILNLINTTGEYVLGKLVEFEARETIARVVGEAVASGSPLIFESRELGNPHDQQARVEYQRSWIGSFYARFFLLVNLVAFFFQLFVVSRLVRRGGLRAGLLWLPIVALGTYSIILFVPLLGYARIAKTLENSSDYSINKTVLQMLFLPTSREIKYKAKQVVDSFFHRFGDVGSAVLVFTGTQIFTFGTR